MKEEIDRLGDAMVDLMVRVVHRVLFFMTGKQQSLFISFFHYGVSLILLVIFFLVPPQHPFRIIMFIISVIILGQLLIFQRCLLFSIETKLSNQPNIIQRTAAIILGKEYPSNLWTRLFVFIVTILFGIQLLHDFDISFESFL